MIFVIILYLFWRLEMYDDIDRTHVTKLPKSP